MRRSQLRHVELASVARPLAWLGVVVCLALVASGARAAAVRSFSAAGDPQTTYTLRGRTLTITSHDPIFLDAARGAHLLVMCRSGAPRGEGAPRGAGRWGSSASSARIVLTGDVTRLVSCDTIGTLHGFPYAADFSRVGFTARWRHTLASTPPPGRLFAHILLSEDWMVVHQFLPPRFLNRFGDLTRLPPAPSLVQLLQRPLRRAGAKLVYAATLGDVGSGNVPAVVGQGTSRTRIELAVHGLDGQLYVLRGRTGRYVGSSFRALTSPTRQP